MSARRGLALIGLLAAGTAQGAERPAAVVPLLTVNLAADEADAITGAIAEGLERAGAGRVRGGREVRRRLPPEGLPPDCPARPDCVADLEDRLEAGALVFVVAARVGAELQVDPTVVRAGRAEPRAALRGAPAELTDPAWLTERVAGWLPTVAPALPGETAAPAAETPPEARWSQPGIVTWVAAGVTVAALSVGAGFGADALAKRGALRDAGCLEVRCADAEIDAMARSAFVADAAFVTAALAAASAVTLYLTVDGGPVTLGVAAGPTGAAVTGRF